MIKIKLTEASWSFDTSSPLGEPGGFGEVFSGLGEDQTPVAVKRLHLDAADAAHRELRVANTLMDLELQHVIPVLDSGLDEKTGRYFIVMPVAEYSLQHKLDKAGPFSLGDAVGILREIASGLSEIPEIAHRDLKPSNVLMHEGSWKIADFGIARFVEESTSLNTLRSALTPQYAAPEQWNLERADAFTDIYALGCIGYAVLTGQPPFPGPRPEDLRRQHLTEAPPPLADEFLVIRSLLLSMLRKQRPMRPPIERVAQQLDQLAINSETTGDAPGLQALAEAGADVAQETAEAEAEQAVAQAAQLQRQGMAKAAIEALQELLDQLADSIQRVASLVKRMPHPSLLLRLDLGPAALEVQSFAGARPIPEGMFPQSGWDVVVGAIISVSQSQPTNYVRSANLWFTDRGQGGGYRWWEVSYRDHAMVPMNRSG